MGLRAARGEDLEKVAALPMKKILILGAGAVARPAVTYLLPKEGIEVIVADQDTAKAEALVAGCPRGRSVAFDAGDTTTLDRHIAAADIVVSLLPWTLHPAIAQICLIHGKHLVTASYVKEEMQAMDREARDKGLIFLNEVGVDPGLDHMSAMQIIDAVRADGGRIDSFFSYCGGLPALESNNNPLGYKFSWSPEGAMLAATNDGRYMEHGEVYDVPGERSLQALLAEKCSRCRRLRSLRQPRCPPLISRFTASKMPPACIAAPCATSVIAKPGTSSSSWGCSTAK
jgi:saccharopine dehydrogenase-like NADP-dependent oxidoreductase